MDRHGREFEVGLMGGSIRWGRGADIDKRYIRKGNRIGTGLRHFPADKKRLRHGLREGRVLGGIPDNIRPRYVIDRLLPLITVLRRTGSADSR